MSLFPAYQEQANKDNSNDCQSGNQSEFIGDVNKNPEWLNNSSYQKVSENLQALPKDDTWTDSSDEENEFSDSGGRDKDNVINVDINSDVSNKVYSTKSSATVKQKIYSNQRQPYVEDICYEDKSRNKRLCTIDTLERALRPRYKLSKYKLHLKHYRRRRHEYFQRYYLSNLDDSKNSKKADPTGETETPEVDDELKNIDELKNVESENKIKSINEEFNKKIAEDPKDISVWQKYISVQDEIAELNSSSYRKKNFKRMVNQKKLSIAEKGLLMNRDSIELLKAKLYLMSELLPADQLLDKIQNMIQKDSKNIVLWQALIMVVQTSCALCKVSKILNLYTKCFPILKQKTKTNPKLHERQSLELLYQCLTFLRNAGLWEQMWEIIRFNLCLNLALDHEALQNIQVINEKTLMSMEELILTSKLPLNQLWLRIESLRESCYWTSVNVNNVDINLIGDDKRLVSSEDVSDFIYPTISRESNFRLVVSFMFSLKIPLLPSRHCTLEDFNLDEHYWSIDSLEFVLPMIYSTIWSGELQGCLSDERVIVDLLEGKLTSGPQCLKYHPARETFLDFIRAIFHAAAQNLPQNQKTSMFVWWLKYERLLVFLAKHDSLQEEAKSRDKKLKSMLKNFLKKPEHRNNLHFYREFALIERELGAHDGSIQILKTAILSQSSTLFSEADDKSAFLSLCRTIFEIVLSNGNEHSKSENLQEVVSNLKIFVATNFAYGPDMPVEDMLYNEILKFLMNPATDESEDAFLLPNIHCDTLICYTYLLLVKNDKNEDVNDIVDLFDRCLAHCDNCPRLKERFYELKVAFLQFHQCQIVKESLSRNAALSATVLEALVQFPNNFYLLSTNAVIESELPCWKIKASTEPKTNVWSVFAKCLAGRARIASLWKTDLKESVDAMVNKMLAYHKAVSQTKRVQDCPLIWKFYMLLLREHNLCEKKGEEIYYEAVNQCPWARSVYMTAAEIAPQILPQIQDLMKEKEIRIHVTPEELDILRE